MITIFQADKNYRSNPGYKFLKKNIENMEQNNNNYFFHVDSENWVSYVDLKIIKLLKLLKNYDDDKIIMYIDALDTLVVAKDNEIEQKFLELDVDVLYSCENGCWPDPNFAKFFTDNRFLNSGTIIFKNIKYQKILEVLIDLYNGRLVYNCDQYYHSIFAVISLVDIKIKLDKNNEIFQCLVFENENSFEKIDNRIKNKITNTLPCVFHGNGTNGKEVLDNLFYYDTPKVSFMGFTEDKNGINFMNSSDRVNKIKVYAEIKNSDNLIIYSTNLDLPYNIIFYISAGINGDYIFTVYDENHNMLIEEKNF